MSTTSVHAALFIDAKFHLTLEHPNEQCVDANERSRFSPQSDIKCDIIEWPQRPMADTIGNVTVRQSPL